MSTLKVDGIRSNSATSDAITLASDGTCTASITNNLSNRNIIINGGMAVSQRNGTTETTIANDTTTYSVDRFAIFDKIDGGNNFTYQQVTSPVPDGFSHALKINTAIADTSISAANYAYFWQIVEGKNIQQANLGTSAAKPLTLSFHVYSNKTGTYTVGLVNQGTWNRTFLREFTISAQNTWEKKTVTFPAITGGTWNDVRVQWCLVAGTDNQGAADTLLTSAELGTSNQVNFADTINNAFFITGVQLEVDHTGSGKPTDFEHRSYSQELDLCKRYFQVLSKGSSQYLGAGHAWSTTQAEILLRWDKEMRTTPQLDSANGTNYFQMVKSGGAVYVNTWLGHNLTSKSGLLYKTSLSGLTDALTYRVQNNNASAYVYLNAEL